jgi:hypothetical protein
MRRLMAATRRFCGRVRKDGGICPALMTGADGIRIGNAPVRRRLIGRFKVARGRLRCGGMARVA